MRFLSMIKDATVGLMGFSIIASLATALICGIHDSIYDERMDAAKVFLILLSIVGAIFFLGCIVDMHRKRQKLIAEFNERIELRDRHLDFLKHCERIHTLRNQYYDICNRQALEKDEKKRIAEKKARELKRTEDNAYARTMGEQRALIEAQEIANNNDIEYKTKILALEERLANIREAKNADRQARMQQVISLIERVKSDGK